MPRTPRAASASPSISIARPDQLLELAAAPIPAHGRLIRPNHAPSRQQAAPIICIWLLRREDSTWNGSSLVRKNDDGTDSEPCDCACLTRGGMTGLSC